MGELLRGALLVKLNVWESKFSLKVADIREGEVRFMQRSEMLNSANLAIFQAAPIMATLGMFAVYTIAQGHSLTAPQAFATLAWVNVSIHSFSERVLLPARERMCTDCPSLFDVLRR
jgi:hypothetical protein